MIYPEKQRYMEDARSFQVVPVFTTIRADFETPLSIFLKVKASFLLESVERGENVGRYSIIALGRKSLLEINGHKLDISRYTAQGTVEKESFESPNPLEKVREYFKDLKATAYEGLPPFWGGAVGFLGYETVQFFEDIPVSEDETGVPDGMLVVPEILLVYDSVKRSVCAAVSTMPGENAEDAYKDALEKLESVAAALEAPLPKQHTRPDSKYTVDEKNEQPTGAPATQSGVNPVTQGEIDPATLREDESDRKVKVNYHMEKPYFLSCVEKCKQYIKDGDAIQVVFSQKFSMETGVAPFDIYKTLRVMNPSPYLFFLDFGDFFLIGSSPEVMVRVQNGEVLVKPIAGTRKRGATITEDNRLAVELLEDPKERAEHMMLVDLGRNDVGRVAVPGSVEVTDFMCIEKYSHVMHIVSTIKGELAGDFDTFDVISAVFPAGTLSGAPKIRAMEIIAELETLKRGPYGGMVLYLGFNGNLDSCITIRTIVLKKKTAPGSIGKTGDASPTLPETAGDKQESAEPGGAASAPAHRALWVAEIQAGAGIVADSVPENEFHETIHKASALIASIEESEAAVGRDVL